MILPEIIKSQAIWLKSFVWYFWCYTVGPNKRRLYLLIHFIDLRNIPVNATVSLAIKPFRAAVINNFWFDPVFSLRSIFRALMVDFRSLLNKLSLNSSQKDRLLVVKFYQRNPDQMKVRRSKKICNIKKDFFLFTLKTDGKSVGRIWVFANSGLKEFITKPVLTLEGNWSKTAGRSWKNCSFSFCGLWRSVSR